MTSPPSGSEDTGGAVFAEFLTEFFDARGLQQAAVAKTIPRALLPIFLDSKVPTDRIP
ncbi:hypothetical protein GCM10009800_52850 [Nocardiopsis rhodophaea]